MICTVVLFFTVHFNDGKTYLAKNYLPSEGVAYKVIRALENEDVIKHMRNVKGIDSINFEVHRQGFDCLKGP